MEPNYLQELILYKIPTFIIFLISEVIMFLRKLPGSVTVDSISVNEKAKFYRANYGYI